MNLVVAVQLLSALAMIGLVLIQHGKGADMGASFGSGASGSLFGASGSANFLSRSTAACATVFFVCTLALAYIGTAGRSTGAIGGSVLDRPAAAQPVSGASAPTTPAAPTGAGAIPTAPSAAPSEGPAASAPAAATVPVPATAA